MTPSETNEKKSRRLLPVYLTTVGVHHHQERKDRPYGAGFHHILFIEKGEGYFETPTKKYLLKANTAVFIKKNCPASYYGNTDDFTTAWVTFNGDGVENILEYFHAEVFSFCENSSLYPKILSCFNLFKKLSSVETLSKAVYDLVISYFTELGASLVHPAVTKAKFFIEENYHKDISVSDISKDAGISSSLLYRLFKENENVTPTEMLRAVRIKNATVLLLSNASYSISEIGELCGFSDTAYFCKVFKAETGMSPNAFRRAHI